MDKLSPKDRSALMAKVRSKGNKSTELKLIAIFKKHNITGWRRSYPIKGSPDFVFQRKKVAVFVDGCFWHGCKVHGRLPKTNKAYWHNKIMNNVQRDKKITRSLQERGWHVCRIWEHSLKDEARVAKKLFGFLEQSDNQD